MLPSSFRSAEYGAEAKAFIQFSAAQEKGAEERLADDLSSRFGYDGSTDWESVRLK